MTPHTPLPLRVAAHSCATDTGRVRTENQDAFHADPAGGLYFVADGMGGMTAGGAAAQFVVKFLPDAVKAGLSSLKKDSERHVRDALGKALSDFSAVLRERARAEPSLKGMGSTVVLALLRAGRLYVANVGDSRAYLLERGHLRRLTKDHSLVAVMLELGKITPEEAERHPFRNKLSRYMGQDGHAVADVHGVAVKEKARLLLCSDGLTGMLDDGRIAVVLREEEIPEAACRRLVCEANEAGGVDNVTALVVDLGHGG